MKTWWACLMTILVAGAESLDFVYEPLKQSSGLYFDGRGDVQLSSTDLKLVTYVDINQAKENLNVIKRHVISALMFCDKIKNETWYAMTDCNPFRIYSAGRLKHLDKLKDILVEFASPVTESHGKLKRAVFSFIGEILKILFGSLDSSDAKYYSEKISELEKEQREFLRISKEQMLVIKSTISSFNSTFRSVQKNEGMLRNGLSKLSNHVNKIAEKILNQTEIMFITQDVSEHSVQIQRSMDECEKSLDIILNALINAQKGIVQPQILTPSQMLNFMHNEQLPAGANLPVLNNPQELLTLIRPKIFIHEKYLVYVLCVPLVTPTIFQLYQIIPFPVKNATNKYLYLEPSREFILSDPTRQTYAKLTRRNVENCVNIDETRLICKQDFPVVNFVLNEDCEMSLLQASTRTIPRVCKIRVIELQHTLWLKLHSNEWLHISPYPETVSILCRDDNTPKSVTLKGQGRVILQAGCKAYGSHSTIIASSEITRNISFPDIIPTPMLEIDCYNDVKRANILEKLQLHIPLSNVLSNPEELKLTSHKVEEVEKMIDEQSWKLDHSFKLHYTSWFTYLGTMIAIIIFVCLMSFCCCACCRRCCFFLWKKWTDHPGCTETVRHCFIKQRIHTGPVHYHSDAVSLQQMTPRRSLTQESPIVLTEAPARQGSDVSTDEENVPLSQLFKKKQRSWR